MIDPTDEMKAAVAKRMGGQLDPWMEAALGDVLALVERDYDVNPKLPPVKHGASGEPWWNHYMEQYETDCICGESFADGQRDGAEERLATHLGRHSDGGLTHA